MTRVTFGRTARVVRPHGLGVRHVSITPLLRDGQRVGHIEASGYGSSAQTFGMYGIYLDDGMEFGSQYSRLDEAKTEAKELLEAFYG